MALETWTEQNLIKVKLCVAFQVRSDKMRKPNDNTCLPFCRTNKKTLFIYRVSHDFYNSGWRITFDDHTESSLDRQDSTISPHSLQVKGAQAHSTIHSCEQAYEESWREEITIDFFESLPTNCRDIIQNSLATQVLKRLQSGKKTRKKEPCRGRFYSTIVQPHTHLQVAEQIHHRMYLTLSAR
mmetsp:Transcript_21544/g.50665  ORF Transcript_21544/g.50665 Transcript_21544/m.50665 type:complete len:183 (+) Transcript_21544:257-805(+)